MTAATSALAALDASSAGLPPPPPLVAGVPGARVLWLMTPLETSESVVRVPG